MSKAPASLPPESPLRGESDALVRRTRYTLRTLVLGIAVTAGVVFALILGQRWGARLDFTATREHTLSPRTVGILRALPEPTAIVVSADVSKVDPRSWERVGDMLGEFGRTGPNAKVTVIDTGRSVAADQAAAVVAELVARDGAVIERHRAVLRDVAAALAAAPPELLSVADQVARRGDTVADAAIKEKQLQLAAALRVAAKDAPDAAERVRAAGGVRAEPAGNTGENDTGVSTGQRPVPPGGVPPGGDAKALPEADTAAQAAAPLMLAAIKALDEASALQPPIAGLGAARDRIAVANDALRSLRPLEALSVSRALRERPTVIVYNSRSTAAIDFDTLFPRSSTVPGGGGAAQPLFVGEEMLGTALASLGVQRPPILVLVHGERDRMLDESGRPLSNTSNAIGKLLGRLSQRRVDIAEWAVAVDPARPVLTKLDPTNDRPKVWFVLPSPPRTSADPRRSSSLADRPQRVQRLGDALRSLLDSGDQVLLALEPSEMPAVGEPDPVCEPLKAWGIKPDTARPLLERIGTPRGPAISAYQTLRASEPGTPIGDALSGLPLILHWPMGVEIETAHGVRAHPVFSVPPSSTAWGESSWLPLRYANVRQPFQPLMPPELPAPDAGRDRLGSTGGWPVVVAAERDRAGGPAPQRLIVVSAPGWFEDLYTQAAGMVDGRRVLAFPGNGELFEASFHWLAGLDELIAPSPRIRDVPRIEPMTEARLVAIRWTLIAGLPLLVLALGFAVRVLRG